MPPFMSPPMILTFPAPVRRFLLSLVLVALAALLAACDRGPDRDALESTLKERLQESLLAPGLAIDSLRRQGSGPMPRTEEGRERRIVYFNAVLQLEEAYDFTASDTLNAAALAHMLGANEEGISGIRTGGNRAGDPIRVHGSVTFVRDDDGRWQPQPHEPVDRADVLAWGEEMSETRRLMDEIRALTDRDDGTPAQRRDVIEAGLRAARDSLAIEIDRLGDVLTIAGGPVEGEYARVASVIEQALEAEGRRARAAATAGSVENSVLLASGRVPLAIIQADVAALAHAGALDALADAEALQRDGPADALPGGSAALRALGGLFPEKVHVIVNPDSELTQVADLAGHRVAIGLPRSGTRLHAEALLDAAGIGPEDLEAVEPLALAEALPRLAAGELDAVIATIAAPARRIQAQAARYGLTLVSLDHDLQRTLLHARGGLYPSIIPAGTYSGQAATVRTVAANALLVGHADMADEDVARLLRLVYEEIDFLAQGSAAGSQITPTMARTGVTLPWHPAAASYFGIEDDSEEGEDDAPDNGGGDTAANGSG